MATLVLPSNRVLGLGDEHSTLATVFNSPPVLEERQALDGCRYPRQKFLQYYGKQRGEEMWSKAIRNEEEVALAISLVEAAEVENSRISEVR